MTGEIENLKELLKEARLWVAYCDAFIIMQNGKGWSEQKVLLQKIDDALANTDTGHPKECPWWKDWHACNCGIYDIKECKLVIPGTVIACGEDGNYCSQECMEKANARTK